MISYDKHFITYWPIDSWWRHVVTQVVVSLTFRELSKIFFRNLCIAAVVVLYISIYENFKLKLCTCAPSMALGTPTKLQLEILTIIVVSVIASFRNIFLESSQNISETTPGTWSTLVPVTIQLQSKELCCHKCTNCICHGPLTRYAKLRVAHAPGMPGTISPPPTSK